MEDQLNQNASTGPLDLNKQLIIAGQRQPQYKGDFFIAPETEFEIVFCRSSRDS